MFYLCNLSLSRFKEKFESAVQNPRMWLLLAFTARDETQREGRGALKPTLEESVRVRNSNEKFEVHESHAEADTMKIFLPIPDFSFVVHLFRHFIKLFDRL